jgi:Ubiquitin carboxyl-terminal hydrolase
MQDGPSVLSDASQQMLIEALPPVLVLHLKRFQYDAATGSVIKIGKYVHFSPELEIPLGTHFIFTPAAAAETEDIS